ncbi:MAG: ABC transporter substrate-binding protein [Halobacteriales archaeon]|nr:ABC transporter substrate-binding protein [Halobacteriales archaeon]
MADNDIDVVPDDIDEEWSLSRRKALSAAGAMSAAALAGCSNNSNGGGGGGGGGGNGGDGGNGGSSEVGGEVLFITDYSNEAWQPKWENELVPDFEGQNEDGTTVNVRYSGFSGNQESELGRLVQAGDPPELNTSTFEQVGDFFAEGYFADVGDVVEQAEELNGELIGSPYSIQRENETDTYYELPHGAYVGTFLYRTDVYDQLGLEVPTNFQEMLENARVIDEAEMDVRGFGLAGQRTGKAHDEFQTWLSLMGANELGFVNPDADNLAEAEVELLYEENKDKIVRLLEFTREIAEYSYDPTSLGWGSSIQNWVSGSFAQQYHLNAWPVSAAAGAGVDDIVDNTGVAILPLWEEGGISREETQLTNPTMDGHHLFDSADMTEGGRDFLSYCYGQDEARGRNMYETEPGRFLPAFSDIVDSEEFASYPQFQEYPKTLDQMRKVANEIYPNSYGLSDTPGVLSNSPIGVYYYRSFHQAEMVNDVVTGSSTPEEAYEYGLGEAQRLMQEARDTFDR